FVFEVTSSVPAFGMGPFMGYQAFHRPNSAQFRANPWSVSYTGGSAFSHDQMFKVTAVPEPAILALLAVGAAGLAVRRRRRRSAPAVRG
ncbi:MAG: PEP-CTERM sorting domain-containing protein, partial [Planctomycetota bacterium]|nr:PEP-CTERM sorting domain-containing protein [Planctomycetota bacterium]